MKRVDSVCSVRLLVCLLLVVAAVTAACKSGGDTTPDPTVPTAVSTSTVATSSTTPVADIAAIPDVIDAPYLDRVLDALDNVELEATRLIVTNKNLVPPAATLLNSIYSDEEFTQQADAWVTAILDDPELQSFAADGPGRRTSVDQFVSTTPACLFIAVSRDYPQSGEHRTEYLSLVPLDRSNDPDKHNPTAWMITYSGVRKDGAQPPDPCHAN